jgi:hypothetical protein
MDFITDESPPQLIVADYVYETFQTQFGSIYDCHIADAEHASLEAILKRGKSLFYVVPEEEATELFNKFDLINHVLISGVIIAPVLEEKSEGVHALEIAHPHLAAIEWMKNEYIGRSVVYKGHKIDGSASNEKMPSFAVWHEFSVTEFGGSVLRAFFDIALDII